MRTRRAKARAAGAPGATPAARFPGILDLQASISRADGSKVYRYLPLGVPKTARDYVRDSVVQGTATGAKFRVKGDLRDFPFKDARLGEFRITADVRDVTYAFVPPSISRGTGNWPALTQLGGELVFERNGMQVKRRDRPLQRCARAPGQGRSPDSRTSGAPWWRSRARCGARWARRWRSSTTPQSRP